RSLLPRLSLHAAGAAVRRQVGLLVPGAVVPLAKETAWTAGPGRGARPLRDLHREPRSSGQFRARAALPPIDKPRPASRLDGFAAVGAGDADAVSRPGVRVLAPLLLLRRSQPGASAQGVHGPQKVPGTVS